MPAEAAVFEAVAFVATFVVIEKTLYVIRVIIFVM